MEKNQVYMNMRKRTLATSPRRSALPTVRDDHPVSDDLSTVMRSRAMSRAKRLKTSHWNGHIELTDECKFGLAIFEIANNTSGVIKLPMSLKNRIVSRNLRVFAIGNTWGETKVGLFRRGRDISICDSILQHLAEVTVEKYVSEYNLITQLLVKMRNDVAVQNRWLPSFSPPMIRLNSLLSAPIPDRLRMTAFEIRGLQFMRPNTIGQWLMTLLIERVRRNVTAGIGLRALFYCICWCTRLIEDRDYQRLELSAVIIRAWLLQGTCRDCLYKSLRELREEYTFEYVFNIADSFSQQIKLPEIRTSIEVGRCQRGNAVELYARSGFLRTLGEHSFLTSPYARTTLQVEIQVLEDQPKKQFSMTGRQTTSLLSVLDMHARVLRADDWDQSGRVFLACIAERCANDGASALPVLCQLVEDLCAIRRSSVEMHTTVSHLVTLLFYGKINAEMLNAYKTDPRNPEGGGAHGFIVRYCFLRAPSPDVQCLADSAFDAFENASARARAELFDVDLDGLNQTFSYELADQHVDLGETWGLALPEPEESLEELIAHGLQFMNKICADDSMPEVGEGADSTVGPPSEDVSHGSDKAAQILELGKDDAEALESLADRELVTPDSASAPFREVPREILTSSSECISVVDPDEVSVGHLEVGVENDLENE